jgi:mannose-6-phosphate isomerase-like protein (cupin superfamily)
MMGGDVRKFRVRELYNEKYREYIVGSSATGRHGVYLVYAEAAPLEERQMAPDGHDEILFLLEGEAVLKNGDAEVEIGSEEAVSLDPDSSYTFVARSNCRYVVAGTHITPHSH